MFKRQYNYRLEEKGFSNKEFIQNEVFKIKAVKSGTASRVLSDRRLASHQNLKVDINEPINSYQQPISKHAINFV